MSKRLLDCEWILLKSLWDQPPQTMKQVVESVRRSWPDIQWNYKTYHSYLRKMEEKGLIVSETRNLKDKLYRPIITQEEALQTETENILARSSYFGSIGRLMVSMMENTKLSEKDREELISFAQRLEKEGKE
jgi:predicted transcriptional regulator